MGSAFAPVLLAAALLAGQAQAPRDNRLWYQAYQDGVRQVGASQWAAAAASLELARARGPQPGRRVAFQGDRVDTFNPDYYLGLSYVNLGRIEEADDAFQRAAKLFLPTDRDYATFQRQSAAARSERLERTYQQLNDRVAAGNVAEAERLIALAGSLGADNARLAPFQQRLSAVKSPASPASPPAVAVVTPGAGQGLPQAGAPRAEMPSVPIGGLPPVTSAPSIPAVQRPPSAVLPNVAGRANVGGRMRGLTLPNQPPRPGSPRPLQERQAAGLFLSGKYAEAARILTSIANPSARARFYFAASLAAMTVTGDRPAAELTTARREVATLSAEGALAQFDADLRFISPRVLTLLGVRP